MNYVIAVFPDSAAAQAARDHLSQNGVLLDQVLLVDRSTPPNPDLQFLGIQKRQNRLMAYWLVPFGFVGGYAFNMSTQYDLLASLGPQGNHIIGGLLGAIAGLVGSLFTGSAVTPFGKTKTPPYAKLIKQGKVLLIVRGAPNVTNKAKRILRQIDSESMESYVTAS
ncbi:MAG: hypothetical protein WBA10_11265 [Elainellaceae cyanobacterium]